MNIDHRNGPLRKGDLQFKYPSGPTSNDDPTKRNLPDSALLNRHEWYEVLYFVNKFANECGQGFAEVAKKAERLIHGKVPPNLHSQEHVRDWLIRNWKMYS